MNVERLEHLIEVLQNVDKKRFSLERWVSPKAGCGTVACAIGWACQDATFNKEGLTLTNKRAGMPKYENHGGWDAVEMFFDLDMDEAYWLFSVDAYGDMAGKPGPNEVIERIKEVLNEPAG